MEYKTYGENGWQFIVNPREMKYASDIWQMSENARLESYIVESGGTKPVE